MFPRDTQRLIDFLFYVGAATVIVAIGYGLWRLVAWCLS